MGRRSAGLAPFDPRALAEYKRCIALAGAAHGICKDYRAAASIDMEHERADIETGRRIKPPLLVMWGEQGVIQKCFKPLDEWRRLSHRLVDSHTVATLDEQNVLLFCDLHLMNEYTSPQAFAGLHEKNRNVAMPGQNVAVVSHIIPTHPVENRVIFDPSSALQASNLKRNCVRHDIALFDTNDALQGIIERRP